MATTDKYDRQLRLWGAEGQRLLAEAHVLLVKAGPTGTETLKNLVLPGVGKFTIVDDAMVGAADLANNFFLPHSELGKPRSEVARDALAELNPDVAGNAVVMDPVAFVTGAAGSLNEFTLVLVTELDLQRVLKVEEACVKAGVPMVVARTMGFIGSCRVSAGSHEVIESKPSPKPVEDLRLADPFPELAAHAAAVDMDSMDNKDYKHTPYCVVLLQAIKRWKEAHGGNMPRSKQEKEDFRGAIKALAKRPWGEEENLEEALANAFQAYTPRAVPPDVQDVLDDPQCASGEAQENSAFSKDFWTMAKALREFVTEDSGGKLPVSGKVPDMTSSTDAFVQLQRIYLEKARADAQRVYERVQTVLQAQGRAPDAIPLAKVEHFCRNAYDLRACRVSRIAEEADPARLNKEDIMGDPSEQWPLLFYFGMRGCDRFYAEHGRFPGANGSLELADDDEDAEKLLAIVKDLLLAHDFQDTVAFKAAHARELARYGGSELHNIAAIIGGVASQEAVKLITHQYVLLNNTYILNGINCTGSVYML